MAVNIEWFGLSSLRLTTKSQNTEVTVVTDPPEADKTGIKLPRNLAADIALISKDEPSFNNIEAVGGGPASPVSTRSSRGGTSGGPFVITNPGEYEIKNVFVYGIKNGEHHTVYMFEMDDLVIMHLGGAKKVTAEVLERAENVDILLVPVGGGEVMDAKQASAMANEIQPRIVIPVHYKTKDSKIALDGVEKFLKEMGAQKAETLNKIKLSKKDLPQEEMKVMVLTNE